MYICCRRLLFGWADGNTEKDGPMQKIEARDAESREKRDCTKRLCAGKPAEKILFLHS